MADAQDSAPLGATAAGQVQLYVDSMQFHDPVGDTGTSYCGYDSNGSGKRGVVRVGSAAPQHPPCASAPALNTRAGLPPPPDRLCRLPHRV